MAYTERDELLGTTRRKSKYFNKTWVSIIGSLFVFAAVCLVFTVTRTGGNKKQDILLDALAKSSSSTPVVTTALGKVKGVILQSRGGRDYNGFYNVPYAQPPIGDLRFKLPVPVKSWKGTRDCTVKGSMCVQISRYNPDVDFEGTEDCLHVNLFTPELPRSSQNPNLPVIVYFFGGAFMHGTANDFNTDYFMDEDVVLVIVESRVGALGYLNTGDMHARGNMGLKDQVMALRWVKENIADFGGDPAKVVAFGTSSGAMLSHAHLLSPMSKGLLSGVMSFSGTMLNPGIFTTNPQKTAQQFGEAMNCTDTINSEALLKCLRNVSIEAIALQQPMSFSPSLEVIPPDGDMSDVFFPDTPANLLLSGQTNQVPWVVGVNSAEAILESYALLLNTNATRSLNKNWQTVLPQLLTLSDDNQTLIDEMTREIHDFYFGNRTICRYSDTRFNLTNLQSDRKYIHPTKTSGLNQAKKSPVYWYYLTKEANVSFADAVKPYFDPPYGVSHADEVQYFFSRPRYPYIPLDSEHANFSILLVKLWVSFAATGAPVNPDPDGVVWPKVDAHGTGTIWFNLDDVPKLVEPFTERLQLWDSFPFNVLYNNYN